MLVIGDIGRWVARGRSLPLIDRCHFAAPWEITPELLNSIEPDFVVSALMEGPVDAVEIARTLSDIGYEGAYRAIVLALPNKECVRHEIQAEAPGLDFDIYVMTD